MLIALLGLTSTGSGSTSLINSQREVSTVVFGVNANLFEGFVVNAVWKVEPDFPKLFLELIGHGYLKLAVFDDQSRYFCFVLTGRQPARDYQQEVAVFWQVVRKLNSLLVASLPNCTNQSVEAFECSVYYLQCLLSNISVQQLVVLVNLTRSGSSTRSAGAYAPERSIVELCKALGCRGSYSVGTIP